MGRFKIKNAFKNVLPFLILFFLFFSLFRIESLKDYFTDLKIINPIAQIKVHSIKNKFNPSLPTLAQIYGSDHSWVATLSAQRIRSIIFTGDIIPARTVNFMAIAKFKDYKWPYLNIADVTKKSDLTIANLESPLIKNCPITNEGMVFCGSDVNVLGLSFAGINLVSLANNHLVNQGENGIKETQDNLQKNSISSVGTGKPFFKNIKGLNFGFLAFNDVGKYEGIANVEENIGDQIQELKRLSDVAIVIFHWGMEYQDLPDERQKYLARLAIDNGADLILGNHPHWIQPVEIYKNKIISYASGNLIFDQMWSTKTRQGLIGKYSFYDNKLVDVFFTPVFIENYGQPRLMDKNESALLFSQLFINSMKLKN